MKEFYFYIRNGVLKKREARLLGQCGKKKEKQHDVRANKSADAFRLAARTHMPTVNHSK